MMWKWRFNILCMAGVALLLLSACSKIPFRQSPDAAAGADVPLADTVKTSVPQIVVSRPEPVMGKGKQRIVELGADPFVADPTPATAEVPSKPGTVTLNFQDTDLREFVKVVLTDVLKENYVMDEKVVGTVTIATSKPIRRETLPGLLEDILSMHGAALLKEDNLYRITPKNLALRSGLSPTLSKQTSDGYAVRIIPLEYIAAQEMEKIVEPFLAEGSLLRVDKKRNLLIVSGAQQDIASVQDTVDVFDVDWLRGLSVGLYPLDYVGPQALKDELDSILSAIEADDSGELLAGLVRIVAIERLQSILLISSTPAALRDVEIWLHRLDRPGKSIDRRLYVYNVQNAKATELGEILRHIFDAVEAPVSQSSGDTQLAPGLSPVEITAEGGADIPDARDGSQQADQAVARRDGGVTLPAGQSVEIIADDVRNALVILATPQDYKMVEMALAKLDIVPMQVLIEASIVEVSLQDDLNYGVEWYFKNSIRRGNVTEGRATLDLGAPGIAALSGFSYTVVDSADKVRLALNALEKESEVNVLSSPSLMVLDNQTAYINVGDEIPVPSRQSVSNIGLNSPTVNEITFRQTGVTLSVTPRVNSSGLVTMEIEQEVSNAVGTTSSDIDAPTIKKRQIESTVAINSGETIVLGGLIQDTATNAQSGIPVLHRIPWLGKLFGQTRDEARRTELLVMITPLVIRNRHDARDVTDEFKRKIRGITPPRQQTDEAAS